MNNQQKNKLNLSRLMNNDDSYKVAFLDTVKRKLWPHTLQKAVRVKTKRSLRKIRCCEHLLFRIKSFVAEDDVFVSPRYHFKFFAL